MKEIILWQVGNGTVHGKTLVMTWIVMIAMITFVYFGVRNLTEGKPGKFQNFFEWVMDLIKGLVADNMDYKKAAPLLAYLVTLFMFVFFCNMLGVIPNIFKPLFSNVEFAQLNYIFYDAKLSSPTSDINTTLGLALISISVVIYMGVKYKGVHYFHHFLEPNPVFLPIHIIDIIAKPMTLGFRLFGNIFAKETLTLLILMLPGLWVFAGGVFLMPVWLAFSIFLGSIQAFVFTVLTIAYIAQAVEG